MRKLFTLGTTVALVGAFSLGVASSAEAFTQTHTKHYTIGTCVQQKGKSIERLNPQGCVIRLSPRRAVAYLGTQTGQGLFDYKTVTFNANNWQQGSKLAMVQQWRVGYWTKVWGKFGRTPVIYSELNYGA